MEELNKTTIDDVQMEISLAKPQSEQRQKKKFQMRQGAPAFPMQRGRGGRVPYEYYPSPAIRRGGAQVGGYQKYPPYAPNAYTPGPYDAYGGGGYAGGEYYGGGYADYGAAYGGGYEGGSYGVGTSYGGGAPRGGVSFIFCEDRILQKL